MSAFIRKILVPVDGSEGADHAVRFAAAQALALDATLVLLHVHHAPMAELVGLASLEAEDVQARLRNIGERHFVHAREVLGTAADKALIVELSELGTPADEIIGAAARQQADLIVMGSRGLSKLDGLLLGSVSEKVVRRAHCPVTIVR